MLLGFVVILVLPPGFCVFKVLVLVSTEAVVTLLGRDVADVFGVLVVGAIEGDTPVGFDTVVKVFVLLSVLVL